MCVFENVVRLFESRVVVDGDDHPNTSVRRAERLGEESLLVVNESENEPVGVLADSKFRIKDPGLKPSRSLELRSLVNNAVPGDLRS